MGNGRVDAWENGWRTEAEGEKATVLVLALISLHMILLLDNCTGNTNLQALSRDVGYQIPS